MYQCDKCFHHYSVSSNSLACCNECKDGNMFSPIEESEEKNMTYFLFYDGVMGEHFVIEGDDNWVAEDAYEEARNVVDVEDELEYLGIVSDEEVNAMGYNVY